MDEFQWFLIALFDPKECMLWDTGTGKYDRLLCYDRYSTPQRQFVIFRPPVPHSHVHYGVFFLRLGGFDGVTEFGPAFVAAASSDGEAEFVIDRCGPFPIRLQSKQQQSGCSVKREDAFDNRM